MQMVIIYPVCLMCIDKCLHVCPFQGLMAAGASSFFMYILIQTYTLADYLAGLINNRRMSRIRLALAAAGNE
jgi:hypothetical protein